MTQARRSVVVADPIGLHARPATRVARAAAKFKAVATVSCDGRVADARSIFQLLGLMAAGGATLEIVAVGDDAANCVDAVAKAIASA